MDTRERTATSGDSAGLEFGEEEERTSEDKAT